MSRSRAGLAGLVAGGVLIGAIAAASAGGGPAGDAARPAVATAALGDPAGAAAGAGGDNHDHAEDAVAGPDPADAPTDAPDLGAADPSLHEGHDPSGVRPPDRRDAASRPARTPADRLLRQTRRHAPTWADVADAEADGYRSIGDSITGYEHYIHPARTADATTLDARRPESLVYRVEGAQRRLVSVMYLLPPGSTMDDVPDLGDRRAQWHLHDDLCWDGRGRVAGLLVDGRCVPGGEHVVTPPMLHVWVVKHPCGPFAGIEGHGGHC